jgi:peptidoglycan hydrolase CwlO-like protein
MRRSNRANSRTLQARHLKSMTKKTTLKELGDMLAHVVKHMATKDDIANLGEQLTSVERELKSIRRDLDDLREKVENVSGFQKEIDHALERIAAIEKHLGLDKKIAA